MMALPVARDRHGLSPAPGRRAAMQGGPTRRAAWPAPARFSGQPPGLSGPPLPSRPLPGPGHVTVIYSTRHGAGPGSAIMTVGHAMIRSITLAP